ncbi:nicotinamide-nucleotide amidohydrolase family protein [candidate division WOR-3 bacterium]|nr:nicotinamide-nucleotide amidohydrolase family protein [candidate division WOR-3 bacterium]
MEDILKEKGLTIGIAESLTGGGVMNRITDLPGSSSYFLGGVVAYSDELKKRILGVTEESLKRYGAVSRECAEEMADGVRRLTSADIGAATTGIAGPTGGTEEKPIGLVYTAVSYNKETICEKSLFKGDRLTIKKAAVEKLLDMVFKMSND